MDAYCCKSSISYHIIFILSVVVVSIISGVDSNGDGCKFEKDGCMYNIVLQEPEGSKTSDPNGCLKSAKVIKLDRAQNDYGSKIDDIEKNFSVLKDTHESRIQELEGTVRDLLGIEGKTIVRGSPTSYGKEDGKNMARRIASQSSLLSNNGLMDKLEEEFNKLRDEIKWKNEELFDAKIKLNETRTRMHETQLKHFKTQKDMVKLENQLITMGRERSILKNQLKDKAYRLDLSSKQSRECEAKTLKQEDRILELFRSESTVKEHLMTAEWNMNKSIETHDKLKAKYNNTKKKHEKTKQILKIREKEVMDCYSAKTSTFCGFEDPLMCGFSNTQDANDFFDWTRGKGRTPSGGTGPSKDHTCQGDEGHYMFIEASSKGDGRNAIIYSPLYRGLKEQCVEFYYHMHGRNMGTLNVYAQARGDVLQSVWRAYGNQGDVWTRARLAVPKNLAMSGYQIAFEGITSLGYRGDMAIDDVSVTDGKCPNDETSTRVKIATNSTAIITKNARKLRKKLKKRRSRAMKLKGKTKT